MQRSEAFLQGETVRTRWSVRSAPRGGRRRWASGRPHLGHLGLLSVGVQQDSHRLHVTLAGADVQGGVAGCGGGVGAGFVVQQQLHQLLVAHPGSAVQGRLVVLAQERQERHSALEFGTCRQT